MSDANGIVDPYEAVLADLRAKRDRIDQAIVTIESVREGVPLTGVRRAETASFPPPHRDEAQDEAQGGVFLGMTIVDAAKKYLAIKRCTQTNTQITNGLLNGGLILNSQEPMNTVGSVLTRRFHENGDIVRVSRGVWGLREWYPRQNFKKKADQGPELAETLAQNSAASVDAQPLDRSETQT